MTSKKALVTLEYDVDRHRAEALISFETSQPKMKALKATAETVQGVDYAYNRFDGDQEMEVHVTAYHAQTRASALKVIEAVIKELRIDVVGEIRVVKERRTRRAPEPRRTPASTTLRVQSPRL